MTTPTFEIKWIFFASSRFVCSDSTIFCCWYMGLAKIAGSGLASLTEGQVVTGYNLCIIHPNYCIIHLIHYSATCVYFSCVSVRVHVCVCVFCMFILVFLVVFYVHFSTLTMFYDHFCIFNWFYGHFTFLYSSYFLFLFILMLIQSKHYFYNFFSEFYLDFTQIVFYIHSH